MCSEIDIISKTQNGIVFKCKSCEYYQVEFNNLNFNFTEKEYYYFSNYITNIDLGYYEHHFNDELHGNKIKLPVGHKNLVISINIEELNELKLLFEHKHIGDFELLSLDKIHYRLYMN